MRAGYKAEDSIADNNKWYHEFSGITFETYFTPFSEEQGRAYVAHYRHRYCHAEVPTSEQVASLRSVEKTLDTLIEGILSRDRKSGAFVRLNTRSPKDAIAINAEDFTTAAKGMSKNDQLKLFFDLTLDSLRVTNGADAIDLLLSSERIYVDILQAFDASAEGIPESKRCSWDLELCVRKWETNLREDLEFRGFVKNYELIALSQYNTFVSYPNVVSNKSNIENVIRKFFKEKVKSCLQSLHMPNTVVDFAILVEVEGNFSRSSQRLSPRLPFSASSLASSRVVVIELNPFNKRTGGALFTWLSDNELEVTEGITVDDVDFRLVDELALSMGSGSGSVASPQLHEGSDEPHDQKEMMLEMLLSEADAAFRRRQQQRDEKDDDRDSNKCVLF